MIDFHTHILPGIDDGSQNLGTTINMFAEEYQQRVDRIVATPHFYANQTSIEHFLMKRGRSLEKLKEMSSYETFQMPKLYVGAEVYYFPGIGKAQMLEKLCIQETNILMLELPFCQWTKNIYEDIKLIIEEQKRTVILVHIERYFEFQKNKDVWNAIFELPLYGQINAGSFLKWKRRHTCLKFLTEKYPLVLGSDCHNMETRPPNMAEGRQVIEKKVGRQVLEEIDTLGNHILGT